MQHEVHSGSHREKLFIVSGFDEFIVKNSSGAFPLDEDTEVVDISVSQHCHSSGSRRSFPDSQLF